MMSLCIICSSIPFRKILEGDPSLPVSAAEGALAESFHVKSHDSISLLVTNGESCRLCNVVADAITRSFWYHHMMSDENNKKPVWLCFPVGWTPCIWIYIGMNKPETKVFGMDVKIYTALGRF